MNAIVKHYTKQSNNFLTNIAFLLQKKKRQLF